MLALLSEHMLEEFEEEDVREFAKALGQMCGEGLHVGKKIYALGE